MNYRDRLVELIESARYWGSNTSEEIADHLIENGATIPVRCRECKEFISKDNLDKEEYPNPLDCDGLCDNTDKYTYADDYYSCGKLKECEGE